MLVLSRMRDETILIGDDVEVTVVDIRGDKVRLGFTATANTSIDRKEVRERKHIDRNYIPAVDSNLGDKPSLSDFKEALRLIVNREMIPNAFLEKWRHLCK